MSDADFWLGIRRAALMLAHLLEKRYGWRGLLIVLTGEARETVV